MEVDERFSKVGKDPRYKRIAKKERKVKIDSRFEKMFTDENFHTKFTTDKRGKVINETEVEDLHKFYEIEEDENEIGDDENEIGKDENEIGKDENEIGKDENEIGEGENETEKDEADNKDKNKKEENSKSVENENKLKKLKKKHKLLASVNSGDVRLSKKAKLSPKKKKKEKVVDSLESKKINFDDIRGETLPEDSDSDSDAESTKVNESAEHNDADADDGMITHGWGDIDENVKCIENAETKRIAVCNCDWDKVGANDLFILFDSFKPTNGEIKSLKIYPSEFGIERMKEEKISGPKELRESAMNDENGEENEQGSSFHMEKLREYQLNRLKYYYAVIECDSVETANKLYEDLDGHEYEMSATRMDLRFIPEDMTFDHEPKSVASGITQLKNYEPVSFHNTALQQTTVRLTWDESDTKRIQTTMRQFTQDDIENMDFKDYLASSSGESEGEEEVIEELGNKRNKTDGTTATQDERAKIYKELMQEIEAKDEKVDEKADMEVSFKTSMGIKADNAEEDVSASEGEDGDEDEAEDEGGDEEEECSNEDEVNRDNDAGEASEDEKEKEISEKDTNKNKETDDNVENQDEGFNDPFFEDASSAPTKTKSKSKKKQKKLSNKHEENLSESELRKKNELELLMLDETDDKKHFNLKNIMEKEKSKKSKTDKKKKRKKKKDAVEVDSFNIDLADPRFGALYSSHLYALDPSEPNFKKTKATDAIITETQKRRKENDEKQQDNNDDSKLDSQLSGLINSVKSKTMLHNWKKEKKLKS